MAAAVVVEGVSKRYRLAGAGEERLPYRTLRDEVVRWAGWPVRWLRGQTRRAEDFWALKDVSFEVQPGEVVGIIGRNGAGKSTLLKVLSRITRPTAGRVRLRGRVGSLLEVGTGFHPELTGRENIFLSGAVLGMSRAEIRRKFDEMVAFAEVERFLDLPVKRYSSGMYMRLAFAVAAHLEPEILLVDEVLAVGDAAFQKKCLGKMGEVARGGRTVLFVSHSMDAVLALCPHTVWLTSGRVVEFASSPTLIRRYMSTEAAIGEWQSDGPPGHGLDSPFFSPRRLSLVNGSHNVIDRPIEVGEQIGILIEGIVDVVHSSLMLGFAIRGAMGETVLWSLITDQPPEAWPPIRQGYNRLVGWLPPYLLNAGDYKVELVSGAHCDRWMSEPGRNAPGLALTIRGRAGHSPFWLTVPRPGLLGTVIPFEVVPTRFPTAV